MSPRGDPTKRLAAGPARPARPRPSPVTVDFRLDLHRLTVAEALPAVERHLYKAEAVGLPYVHIVHGHGTGALRGAVREYLDGSPIVARHYSAGPAEGGPGVTVAELRSAPRPASRNEALRLAAPKPLRRR